MTGDGRLEVSATLNIPDTVHDIQLKLVQVESQLKPINVSLNIDSNTIKTQTTQIQSQLSNLSKTNIPKFKVPIDFNVSANDVKEQLFKIVSKIRGGDKGTVIDYKVNLDEDGNFENVMLKYRNETNQVTESLLKLGEAGNWSEVLKSVSQNIEQTTQKAGKLTNATSELIEKYKLLNTQVEKSGVGSLNNENVSGFKNAIDTNNIQQATHYLTLLRTEYQQLNAETSKQLPQNAIDNMNEKAQKLSSTIDTIEAKFSTIRLGGLSQYSTQVDQVGSSVKELKTNLNAFNEAQVGQDKVAAFNKLKQSVDETKKSVNDLAKAQQALEKIDITDSKFTAYLSTNEKVAEKFPEKVAAIKSSISSLRNETDTTKLTSGLQEVNRQFTDLRANAKAVGAEGRTFFGELGNDIKKMAEWTIGGTAIFGTINAIKQMVSNVEELNKAMTNIQIASGATTSEAQKMMSTYGQMGQTLGATTTEVAESADDFLRQGKSVAETNILIKNSMMLSKLGEIDSSTATQYLTSAMKGYGVSVNDTVGIVDKLTKVDQISATSAGGLAEAMSKTANMANSAGVSMDKLIGMLAVTGEVTQKQMSEIGTSYQAIFSRMGNVAANKDVDAEGESLNNVQTVLDKLGIHLRDAQGNFRNFGTVLDEVASKWKSYTNVEQNQVGTAIAGKEAECSNIQQCIVLAA